MTEATDTNPTLGKDALLDAASVLFDEAGIDAVAMNEIVRASGHRNRSAILYHFGSKDEVVRAVVERSMVGPDVRRHQLLDELLARDPQPTVAAIATVVVQPLTELLDSTEGRRHLRLLGQLLGHPRLLASAQAALRGNESMARCADLVVDALTHLPDHLRQERVALLVAFVMRAYADQARLLDAAEPPRRPLSGAAFTAHLVGLIVAILDAPVPGPPGVIGPGTRPDPSTGVVAWPPDGPLNRRLRQPAIFESRFRADDGHRPLSLQRWS